MKYIIMDVEGGYNERPIIFADDFNHSDMARFIRNELPGLKVISAGMIYATDEGKGEVYCYGNSVTLGVGSREQDTDIIQMHLKTG